MKSSEQARDEAVDRLVGNHLERYIERIDSSVLLERIRMSRQISGAMGGETTGVNGERSTATRLKPRWSSRAAWASRRSWAAAGSWAVLAGLGLLVAFFGGRQFGPEPASAAGVLRDLQVVHQTEIDRCYRVQYAPDPQSWDESNPLEGPSHSVLWTRGDRFWSDCSIGDIRLIIGRAADGTLWIRHSPDEGHQFISGDSQLPDEVALLCAANSMTVPRLVDDVLADFELRVDSPQTGSGPARTLVWASLKPGHTHPLIASAVMEIDRETRGLVRLVLWMKRDGRPRGTVSYTFLKRGTQEDDQYQLHAHLDDDAVIETHRFQQ